MGLREDILEEINDRPVEDVRVGVKYTGVRIGRRIGVARTNHDRCETPSKVGDLIGTEVSGMICSDKAIESSIGAAAINAQIIPRGNISKGDIFKRILETAYDYENIGVVGKFPFTDRIEKDVFVFEKKDVPGCLPASKADEILPKCDLVVITGSVFANNSLEHLLEISGGYSMVIGPSTPLSPILFEYGADLIAGIANVKKSVLDIVGQGGGTRDFKRFADSIIMEMG